MRKNIALVNAVSSIYPEESIWRVLPFIPSPLFCKEVENKILQECGLHIYYFAFSIISILSSPVPYPFGVFFLTKKPNFSKNL